MKKTNRRSLAITTTVLAMFTSVSFEVQAQSGSRLCGFISNDNPGNTTVMIAQERRENGKTLKKVCSKVNNGIRDVINKDPKLSRMEWIEMKRWKCEYAGEQGLTLNNGNNDICEKMKAEKTYIVKKQGGAETVFTRK